MLRCCVGAGEEPGTIASRTLQAFGHQHPQLMSNNAAQPALPAAVDLPRAAHVNNALQPRLTSAGAPSSREIRQVCSLLQCRLSPLLLPPCSCRPRCCLLCCLSCCCLPCCLSCCCLSLVLSPRLYFDNSGVSRSTSFSTFLLFHCCLALPYLTAPCLTGWFSVSSTLRLLVQHSQPKRSVVVAGIQSDQPAWPSQDC